mgnify:CR=1 FL=1
MPSRPELQDFARLAEQLEKDRELSMDALKARDHLLAANCSGRDDARLLLCWLDAIAPAQREAHPGAALIPVSYLLATLLGFFAMAGFLLGSSRGLVNVLVLLGVFVLLQCLMSVFSAIMLASTARGNAAAPLAASPARWLALRSLPDGRSLREASGVLRLLGLRFGQAWGMLFTLGALAAFVLVPALSDFSFVWGSTFSVSPGLMQGITDTLAVPWSALAPWATVAPEVIDSSRFHPALYNIDRAGIESMRGWWSFLFMCLVVYALLPRLLLWIGARIYYPRLLQRCFVGYPGARLVLQRMRQPLIRTQATAGDSVRQQDHPREPATHSVPVDGRLLLLDWSNALAGESTHDFEELLAVDPNNVITAGLGPLREDLENLQQHRQAGFDQLLVVVKSWEPPMAELADLLGELAQIGHCTLYLLPLAGKSVPHRKVDDWRSFARELPFTGIHVSLLNRVTTQ